MGSSSSSLDKCNTNTNTNNTNNDDPLQVMGLPSPLILGSASYTRKLILKELNINYHPYVRSINEKSIGNRKKDKASDLVLKISKAKAEYLVQDILLNYNKKNISIVEGES